MRPEGVVGVSPRASSGPALAEVQRALMNLITGRRDGHGDNGDNGGATPSAAALVAGDGRASAEERVAVYAYMYQARLNEALESQFPRLARHLGAEAFATMAAGYVADEPSRHPSLRFLGQRLPAWLAAHHPERPELAGLAALEWARTDVFDEVDETTMSMDDLRAWPAERFGELPVRLLAAHRLVVVPAGSAALWDSLGEPGAVATDVAAGGDEALLVWREGTVVFHRPVGTDERAALALAAAAGTVFGVICDALVETRGEEAAPAHAFTWMAAWLADGLLVAPPR